MIVEIRDEVVTLSGALTKNQWGTIESAVALRLRQHVAGVIINLGALTQITTDGAMTFRDAALYVKQTMPGARMVLANVPANVVRVLRDSGGLGSSLAIVATVAEARASLNASRDLIEYSEQSTPTRSVPGGDSGRQPVVIAGLLGSPADEHAVAVACRLASTIPVDSQSGDLVARLHLAYMLIVPRDRSLLAPMDSEPTAVKRLTQFATAVKAMGCVGSILTQIERTRDGGIRLTDLASELRAEFLVLAVGANASSGDVALARYVVEHAPCEVIVNRVPLADLKMGNDAEVETKEKDNDH